MGIRVSEIGSIVGLDQWNHWPAIAAGPNDTWTVFCHSCSERAADYVKCEYLDEIPGSLAEAPDIIFKESECP